MVNVPSTEVVARLALKQRDPDAASHCARELAGFGFVVRSVGARGVGFAGSVDLFESVFGSTVVSNGSRSRFATPPTFPDRLAGVADSVYFPTRPDFL